MSIKKKAENEELANQISVIKETVKTILKNVQFGSNENLLRDLAKIDTTASRIQLKLIGTPVVRRYKKILVPYDGSSFSKKALYEALELAKSFNSKVYILSVMEIASDVPSGVLSEVINKKLDKLKHEISLPKKFSNPKKLQQQINESAKYGVDVQVELQIGNVADSVLKFANQNKVDLITIGSRGLRGMKKITALGSVSRRVSEEARCPVMIIR